MSYTWIQRDLVFLGLGCDECVKNFSTDKFSFINLSVLIVIIIKSFFPDID